MAPLYICNSITPRLYPLPLGLQRYFREPTGCAFGWLDEEALLCYGRCCREFGGMVYASAHRPLTAALPDGHCAGMALDMGMGLTRCELARLRRICYGIFDHVQPEYITPSWVHAELHPKELCGLGTLPVLTYGDCGAYVLLMQTALCRAGYAVPLSGRFGAQTQRALTALCAGREIHTDSVDLHVWRLALLWYS